MDKKTTINIFKIQLVKESAHRYNISPEYITMPSIASKAINEIFHLNEQSREHMAMLTLATTKKISGAHIISIGSNYSTISDIREIFKTAILNNSSGIIIFHNHPSGSLKPSSQDIEVTQQIEKAGNLLNISLIDHIIIGHDKDFLSMLNEGHIKRTTIEEFEIFD